MGKPKVQEQKPTAQEIANFEISRDKLLNYQQRGIPLQNEMIRLRTGRKLNPATNQWEIDPNAGVLNADGSVRTDAGQAMALAQQQWKPLLQGINPNNGRGRTGMLGALQQKMRSDAGVEAQTRFGQQTGYLQGLMDVAEMGRGNVSSILQGQQGLAGQAANQAAYDAKQAFQDRLERQQAVGKLAGIGQGYLMSQVPVVAQDGSYINGAYDNSLRGVLGRLV
ncbi:hypothetical protein [Thiolinea disciformis]|uniref:hypothetical protein n=1 Tax=Thiolinea disciformis TaxID=125614 RepID=UPI000372A310|nr:hypothetical protein [Thiolinea disciformis]